MSLLLLLAGSGGAGGTPSLTVAATAPAATSSITLETAEAAALTIAATAPAPQSSMVLSATTPELTIGGTAPTSRSAMLLSSAVVDPATGEVVAETGWQVRAVTEAGTLVNLVNANVGKVSRAVNGQESADLTIGTLHPDASTLDLFSHEVQLWLDGDLYFWGRPARKDAARSEGSDETVLVVDGLFSYFYDEVVGGVRNNHIVSPHQEPAGIVGGPPNHWTVTANVEDAAVVDNNAEFWQAPVAIQLNNSEAGQDAFAYQRYTVPAEFDGIPFAAMAYLYVADDHGGAPAWGGPAYQQRGLMLMRLDPVTLKPKGVPKIAQLSDDMKRNTVQRLQTDQVLPRAGEILDVRIYSPDAWVVYRYVGVYDGRALKADRIDKTEAWRMLAGHAQDTTLGKQDHGFAVEIVEIGEPISREWAWHDRANIGEEMARLADTFEFHVSITATTRTLRVKRKVGTTRDWLLTKEDFHGWGLGSELGNAYSRVIMQGQGSGIARDEWVAENTSALNGTVREQYTQAPPDTALAQLRDQTADQLAKVQNVEQLPRAVISGARAKEIQPGDTVNVNIDHGSAQWAGQARAMKIVFDAKARTAELDLEPVTA